ncbi:chemotaxis protein CheW [Christensenella intestinihominis]|uniref:chemotaxis protein CheW n=1 Tax=Christensenella intestinihominis TaxID=1851429 RepID=UPI00082C0749|nr:chemotaxis protein CheW [Christensenella intestinihominis]
MEEKNSALESGQGELEKYLTFFINGQCCGLPISLVMEIIGVQKIAEVPEFPIYAKGIINLRGLIVPLIDLNLRVGYEEQEYTSKTCVIVVNVEGIEIGLIVDAVDEVLDINYADINPPPQSASGEADRFVSGVAVQPEKLILLMSCEKIIGDDVFEH